MNFFKRFLSLVIVLILSFSFSFVTAFAEGEEEKEQEPTDRYGTPEKGIVTAAEDDVKRIAHTDGLVNGSFNEGFRYWARLGAGSPADLAKIVQVGENDCIELDFQTVDDILTTVRFRLLNDKIYSGKRIVVIYDWLGDQNFDVELTQVSGSKYRVISSGIGKPVYVSKSENEWNTTATSPLNAIFHSDKGFYFTIKIKLLSGLPSTAKIDNFRIALVNNNGVLYDLNGNEIKGVPRKAGTIESQTTVVTKHSQVKVTQTVEGSVVDKKTIILLCVVGGGALCILTVSIVLMHYYNSKPKAKKVNKKTSKAKTREENVGEKEQ